MNILILSNKDIASCFALNQLVPELTKTHDVHLWLSAKVGKSSNKPEALQALSFIEQTLFNSDIKALIKGDDENFQYFDGFNRILSSQVREQNKINSPESIEELKSLSPNLIISIRFGGILKEGVINIPEQGVLNLHSGILPDYRGVMATFWAMHNGESEMGTTLHTIDDSSIDTGNIVKISKQPIDKQASYLTNVLNLYIQGVSDILEAVANLEKGEGLSGKVQSDGGGYYSFPEDTHLAQFHSMNYQLVNQTEYINFIAKYFVSAEGLADINQHLASS